MSKTDGNHNLGRIIPPTFQRAELALTGITPLLMHRPTLLDPLHPLTREMRKLTTKPSSSRTVDDHMNINRIDWLAGIYHNEELGPYEPAKNIKGCLAAGGGRWKIGATIRKFFVVADFKVPVVYDGPRDLDGLWEEAFRDVRPVRNSGKNGGQVPRCRPCFEDWSIEAKVAYDPAELDYDKLCLALERAGIIGLGDYRDEFGKFIGELKRVGVDDDDVTEAA